uniref:Choloylglycine hydrolase/NAAA C-terminal domain-containing protein n=1 Tax=Tetradesmus obliquus TaxID=3088 RepID=A0A383VYD6_TETOB|eukprot:jgi/Sobl393_1/16753/SZX70487.1
MLDTRQISAVAGLVLLCYGIVTTTACTDAVIKDQCSNAVVSSRTLSFAAELSPRVTAASPGAALRLLEVADNTTSTFGTNVAVKHRFICISHAPTVLEVYPASDPIRQQNHAICIDGLNAAGLSIAVLYQENTTSMPFYDRTSSKTSAVNFLDLPAFLLARYATAAAVEKDLKQNLQVVWAPRYNAVGRLVAHGAQDAPPFHITVHDSTGASLVLQFRHGVPEVLHNPLGVFANAPFLQEQLQHHKDWMQQHNLTSDAKPNGKLWPLPGDYSSPSRFTRMAMVRAAALATCWPTVAGNESQLLSPGTLPGRQYPQHSPALLAVLGITQTVYLPRGMDDDGQAASTKASDREVTPYSTLRDHTSKVFFYRTGNNIMYRAVSLASAAWPQGKDAISSKPLVPPQQSWAMDVTNTRYEGPSLHPDR